VEGPADASQFVALPTSIQTTLGLEHIHGCIEKIVHVLDLVGP
jgi:hypothetical protein